MGGSSFYCHLQSSDPSSAGNGGNLEMISEPSSGAERFIIEDVKNRAAVGITRLSLFTEASISGLPALIEIITIHY
jgi:hypothetical protein